jgi:hypothetical protein
LPPSLSPLLFFTLFSLPNLLAFLLCFFLHSFSHFVPSSLFSFYFRWHLDASNSSSKAYSELNT